MAGSRQSSRVIPPESFGSRLQRQRHADDKTQAELGAEFGVSQQTIGAWERGERPGRELLAKVAPYVGLKDEQELASLLDSRDELLEKPALEGTEADEPADTNDAAMRLLLRTFAADRERGFLSPEAASIYRDLIQYFGTHRHQ